MPGGARNLGLDHADQEWIAFLDIETVPPEPWLETQFLTVKENKAEGTLGGTTYVANSFMSELIRDAIYGHRPIPTIPGAVLHSKVFINVGRFIPNTRAAEDTEWMIRARAMRVRLAPASRASVNYLGLRVLGLGGMVKKWRRNYLSSRTLQHQRVQISLIWLVAYVVASLAAFNWNAIVAGWQTSSPYYVDHVTKIVSLSPFVFYLILRGLILPLRRGVPTARLLPVRFILLAAVAGVLDALKIISVTHPKRS